MKLLFFLVVFIGLITSCVSLQNSVQRDCNEITELELNILSENCEYIDCLLSKGLMINSNNQYLYDLRIVHIWKYTECFKKYTFSQFESALDKPNKTINSIEKQIHHYLFYKKNQSYSQCTIVVRNDSIVKNYCVDNIKITQLGVN